MPLKEVESGDGGGSYVSEMNGATIVNKIGNERD